MSGSVDQGGHRGHRGDQASAGQAVQPVGQVDRVRRPHNDQNSQRYKPQAEWIRGSAERHMEQQSVGHGRLLVVEHQRCRTGDSDLCEQFITGGNTVGRAAQFDQIIDDAHHGHADGHQQRRGHKAVSQISETQQRRQQRGNDEQSAHRRRGLFVVVQPDDFGRIAFDRFPESPAKPCDPSWSHQHGHRKAHPRGQRRAWRDLLPCR